MSTEENNTFLKIDLPNYTRIPVLNNDNQSRIESKERGGKCFIVSYCLNLILWWLLFSSFSNDPSNYNSDKECVYLLNNAKDISYFYFILVLFTIALIVFNILIMIHICFRYFLGFVGICNMIYWIRGIYYLIVMTNAISYGENCGYLRTLSWVWLVLSYLFFILIFFIFCIYIYFECTPRQVRGATVRGATVRGTTE